MGLRSAWMGVSAWFLIAPMAVLSACVMPPALSDGRQRTATEPPVRTPDSMRPAQAGAVAVSPDPAVGQPSSSSLAAGAPPAPPVVTLAPGPPIALVLPLDSPTYGRAADAVRAGFDAAAQAAGVRYGIHAHTDGEVLAAIAKARASGAQLIVGPLLRDDLRTVVTSRADLPWVIALNQLDDGTALPARVYTLALAIESDARQLARRARGDGARTAAVIGSDNALQKRFASAFIDEWILLGGGPPMTLHFDRAPDMLALLRREMGRAPVDAVLLAVDGTDAALAKPYVGAIATYTSSQVNDRQPRELLRDLDDVWFVDIPWLAEPDALDFARIPRPELPNAALDRLYALGIDAFGVAWAFADGPPDRLEFDGATGHLSLDASRQFVREGRLLQFRAGQIVPAGTQ